MKASHFTTDVFKAEFREFWRAWHDKEFNPCMASRYGISVVGLKNDRMQVRAIGYMYPTIGSDICYLGFVIRNPELSPYIGGKAVKLLIQEAEDSARRMGYHVLYTTFEVESLRKYVKKLGYRECSETQILIKEL